MYFVKVQIFKFATTKIPADYIDRLQLEYSFIIRNHKNTSGTVRYFDRRGEKYCKHTNLKLLLHLGIPVASIEKLNTSPYAYNVVQVVSPFTCSKKHIT